MTLEWLRRHDPKLDAALRTYLFAAGSIVGREEAARGGNGGGGGGAGRLARHRQPQALTHRR